MSLDGDAVQRTDAQKSRQLPHHLQAHPHGPRPLKRPGAWHYTEMGRLVADAGKRDWDELTAEYGSMLMEGLSVRSPERSEGTGTRGKHVNVLQHLMGYLQKDLSSEDKAYRKQVYLR